MGNMIVGSLCLTDILEAAKAGHSSVQKSEKNGKLYLSVVVWENDEVDKFGFHFGVQLGSTKEKRETEKKQYIGNLKRITTGGGGGGETQPATAADITKAMDNLPF